VRAVSFETEIQDDLLARERSKKTRVAHKQEGALIFPCKFPTT